MVPNWSHCIQACNVVTCVHLPCFPGGVSGHRFVLGSRTLMSMRAPGIVFLSGIAVHREQYPCAVMMGSVGTVPKVYGLL